MFVITIVRHCETIMERNKTDGLFRIARFPDKKGRNFNGIRNYRVSGMAGVMCLRIDTDTSLYHETSGKSDRNRYRVARPTPRSLAALTLLPPL